MIIPGLKHITNKGENYACSLCGELTSPKRLLEHITSKSHALECLKKDHVEGQLYLNKVRSVVFKVVHLGWEFSTCRHLVEFVLTCYQLLDCPFTVLQLPPPQYCRSQVTGLRFNRRFEFVTSKALIEELGTGQCNIYSELYIICTPWNPVF